MNWVMVMHTRTDRWTDNDRLKILHDEDWNCKRWIFTCDCNKQLCEEALCHFHPWKKFYFLLYFLMNQFKSKCLTLEMANFFFPRRAWTSLKLPLATALWMVSIFCWKQFSDGKMVIMVTIKTYNIARNTF